MKYNKYNIQTFFSEYKTFKVFKFMMTRNSFGFKLKASKAHQEVRVIWSLITTLSKTPQENFNQFASFFEWVFNSSDNHK